MTHGKILVVLPTLGDRLSTLEETLESIDEQRAQVNLQLVVILPASATEARKLAASQGACLVDDPRKGISHAINLGVETATDEQYYAWIGDDDLFRVGGLHTLRTLMEESPANVVAFGGCDYIDPAGRTIVTNRAGKSAQWLQPWGPNLIPHPGSIIRIADMREVGLFDTDLKYAMDLDMFLKLRHRGTFVATKSVVAAFRWHPESVTVGNRRASSRESEQIKLRYLPTGLRPVSPLWSVPVRIAAAYAARSISKRAASLERGTP
ncbi:MAG: glycosyltransferase [Nocardioidaceae bacterium]